MIGIIIYCVLIYAYAYILKHFKKSFSNLIIFLLSPIVIPFVLGICMFILINTLAVIILGIISALLEQLCIIPTQALIAIGYYMSVWIYVLGEFLKKLEKSIK